MTSKKGNERYEGAKYFSTLYYKNQEWRDLDLPTEEDELEKTDYEGKRYLVPEEMENVFGKMAGKKFIEINEVFENEIGERDIRYFRKYLQNSENSDYKYRFWLQHEVESMSSGNRSMRILTERYDEEITAMLNLDKLAMKLAKQISDYTKNTLAKNYKKTNPTAKQIPPQSRLHKWNESISANIESLDWFVKKINLNHGNLDFNFIQNTRNDERKNTPIFWDLARESLSILFKTINETESLRSLVEIEQHCSKLGVKREEGMSEKQFRHEIWKAIDKPENYKHRDLFTKANFVCEGNQLFTRLYRRIERRIRLWIDAYLTTNEGIKDTDNILRNNETLMGVHRNEEIRKLALKLSKICAMCFNLSTYTTLNMARFEELDVLYSEEYDSTNSRPNVVRMSNHLLFELDNGDHAIIRHFQEDVKRNMYCLPKKHSESSKGGFLNQGKTVSEPPALTELIENKKLPNPRFEPSDITRDTLNILQGTQWSINLDFLHFIIDIKFKGDTVESPRDIRHLAWMQSDNFELKKELLEKLELDRKDRTTKARLITVNSTLKQVRKNLLNAGNVFWHSWFCDWRGRFNAAIKEISPQGDDLSKALLLFTEWKPIGASGKGWLYVRAYDLFFDIFKDENEKKEHVYKERITWTEEKKSDLLSLGDRMCNKQLSDDQMTELLDELKISKMRAKGEQFQRIAFLFEFTRIHNELKHVGGNWDLVKSGLPIHLDASCNGFQHMSALLRNKKLAKSVNLLNNEDNKKGDLYQEVIDYAKNELENHDSEDAKELREMLEEICGKSEEDYQKLIDTIFTREIGKSLVMIAGYGATDFQGPICYRNGKRPGWYQNQDKEFRRTLHPESILALSLGDLLNKENEGFEKIRIEEDNTVGFKPDENCKRLYDLGKYISNYIDRVIAEVTENSFKDIEKELARIYGKIDQDGKNILNRLAFSWRISKDASKVRYVKWKLKSNKYLDKIPPPKLPKDAPVIEDDKIVEWLNKTKTLDIDMKKRLNKLEKEYIEYPETLTPEKRSKFNNSPKSSYVYRKLKDQIFACVEYVIRKSMHYEENGRSKLGPEGKQAKLFLIRCYTDKDSGYKAIFNSKIDLAFIDKNGNPNRFEINKIAQEIKTGMVPNFIHSFDALHMQMVIQELYKQGVQDIWTVHDSFGVHMCHVDEMRRIVKNEFVKLHEKPLDYHIQRLIETNKEILDQSKLESLRKELNDLEDDWIDEVNESLYFIS
ncbi:MAG: DNA-directed RNA polymerase [Candidatus Poseidoniaceae archaeon]